PRPAERGKGNRAAAKRSGNDGVLGGLRRSFAAVLAVLGAVVLAVLAGSSTADAQGRVQRIRQRGALVCGVAPGVAGFARVDDRGRYSGLDVDVCRAGAAAIFG